MVFGFLSGFLDLLALGDGSLTRLSEGDRGAKAANPGSTRGTRRTSGFHEGSASLYGL